MNLDIISIIQSCNTLHELKEEFKKPFGWFRFISKNKTKKFKNLVDNTWGENQVNPKNSKETQPLYYEDKFKELSLFSMT